ncbi:MAG: DNA primase [Oscillospiraceae bacterium]|nr:DNA primase [Oscillospiraceae bacterium]
MAIPEDFIESLKINNPIEQVMTSYASLKRSSRDYVCLCPFHSEKSPSCHINVGKQFFHCFGCGAGGDVITLVMKAENLEYIEALKFLAERAGMTMPEDAKNNDLSALKTRILEMNRTAARYFNHVLTKEAAGEKGRLYFGSRGLSPGTITKYGLGYAPGGWQNLMDHLKSQGFKENEIIAANLARQGQKGGLYDSFRDRVMFPIIDLRGNVIAFGGRVIDGDGPKYLNSSDTPVFKKSRNLFSLNFAKRSSERRLILAEGYMDVIAVNQAGFENVVATLGTALTPEQARLMAQYADEVIIAYDSDGAGQNATHKAINLLSEAGVKTKIIKMEGAKDPDEFIKKFGSGRFKQLLDNSDGAVNFELNKCKAGLDLDTDTGRVDYLKRCIDVLVKISSPVERSVYISKVAAEQGVSKDAIEAQVNSVIRKQKNVRNKQEWSNVRSFADRRKEDPQAARFPREYRAEQGIIAYLDMHPDDREYIFSQLSSEDFVTEFHKKVYKKFVENTEKSQDFNISSLNSEFSTDEMGKIFTIISESSKIDISRKAAEDFIKTLTEHRKKISAPSPGEMSEEDFAAFAARLRSRKSG